VESAELEVRGMMLTEDDMKIVLRWFNALETVATEFLERADWELVERINAALPKTEPRPKHYSRIAKGLPMAV
jgi:hypothetical protein